MMSRRGLFIMLIGTIYAIIGAAYLVGLDDSTTNDTFAAALHFAPMRAWGAIWASVGLIGVAASFFRRLYAVGYAALEGWSSFWAMMAFGSTLSFDSQRGWLAGLVYATFAGAIAIVSGMVDKPTQPPGQQP